MLVFCCSFRNSSHQSRVRRRVLRWFRTRETDTQPTGRAHVERLNPYVFPTFSGSLPRPAGRLGRHDPAQPRRAAAAAHQPSTGAPCISTRSAVLARPISLKSKSVGTSASLSDRHRIRSKISLGFEAPSRQHITFAAGPSEIRRWLLLLDPPEIHPKQTTIPAQDCFQTGLLYSGL